MATITGLIDTLQEKLKKHGDVEVVYLGPKGLSFEFIAEHIPKDYESKLYLGSPYLDWKEK